VVRRRTQRAPRPPLAVFSNRGEREGHVTRQQRPGGICIGTDDDNTGRHRTTANRATDNNDRTTDDNDGPTDDDRTTNHNDLTTDYNDRTTDDNDHSLLNPTGEWRRRRRGQQRRS